MKTSNVILLGALGIALFFSLVFQLSVHRNVKKIDAQTNTLKVVSESRDVPNFIGITAENRVKIHFQQDSTISLTIHAPEDVIDSVKTLVMDGTLNISLLKKLRKKDSVVVKIKAPILKSLELSGQSHFTSMGPLSGEILNLEFRDSSSGDLMVSYDSIHYINNTEGEVNLKGEIKQIQLGSNTE